MSAAYRPLPDFYDSKSDKEKVYTNYAVSRLNDYWHLKGMFMRGKHDPLYAMTDSAFHTATYDFLSNYTSIDQYKFWHRLNLGQKMRLCKYFTLQEDALKTTISSDDTSAMVCVLLAGSVTTISNLDPTVVTHGVGTLLGAVDVFNAEMDDPRFEDDDYERVYERLKSGTAEQPLERPIYTALMPKGVVLRLTISGYRKAVRSGSGAEIEGEEEEEEEADYKLPDGLELTEDDRKTLFTRKLCRKNIPKVYYEFLRDEDLLPLLSSSEESDFVKSSPAGSAVTFGNSEDFEETLFIIITGCARVEVDRNGSLLADGGRLSFKTKISLSKENRLSPDIGVVVKKNSMPISRIENGGVLLIVKEHFRAADGAEGLQLRPSTLPSLSPGRKTPAKSSRETTPDLYRIAIRFEKATNYLAIPYRKIADAVREMDARGIRDTPIGHNLENLSRVLTDRLGRLAPWVGGAIEMEAEDTSGHNGASGEEGGTDVVADDGSSLLPLQGASLLLPKQWNEHSMLLGSRQQPLGEALPVESLRLNYSMSTYRVDDTQQQHSDDRSYEERAMVSSSFFSTEVITEISDELAATPMGILVGDVIDNDSITSDA